MKVVKITISCDIHVHDIEVYVDDIESADKEVKEISKMLLNYLYGKKVEM